MHSQGIHISLYTHSFLLPGANQLCLESWDGFAVPEFDDESSRFLSFQQLCLNNAGSGCEELTVFD